MTEPSTVERRGRRGGGRDARRTARTSGNQGPAAPFITRQIAPVDILSDEASEIIEKLVYNRNNIIDFKNENLKYACIKCQEILKCVKEIHPECIDIETQFEMKKDIFEIVKKFNSNIIDNKEILDKYKFLKYETFKRYNNISKSSIIKFCENYECKCGIAYQNLCNCCSRKIITKFNKKMCENCDKWICRC